MEDIEKELKDEISKLPKEFLEILRSNDSLIHFSRNFILNFICRKLDLKIDYEEMNNFYCKKNNIKSEDELIKNLITKGMRIDDHQRNLSNAEKIKIIALKEFSKNAENEFIKNKSLMDLYTYSLITVKDSDLAHELYLQIESDESDFSSLAKEYSSEGNLNKLGVVGPVNLVNTHPLIREKLFSANIGELFNPFLVDNWWVILRLEEKNEAKFDDAIKSKILFSLFDQWINILTINTVKNLLAETIG